MGFPLALTLCTSFFILLADALSKYWVHTSLPIMSYQFPTYPYGGIAIFKDFYGIEFSITHLINYGAAWGVFGGYQDILLVLRICLILALIVFLLFFNRHKEVVLPFCLVLAGAIGNVIDYFIYGHVVDMLHFVLWGYHFPVFNVADSAVCIGISWLILLSAWQDLRLKKVSE
ncbi:MAG: signal peptidase II [Parachlamydiaceae bacterium]|nr:signal peptidase II [Parachlamydiaceae bacterium]